VNLGNIPEPASTADACIYGQDGSRRSPSRRDEVARALRCASSEDLELLVDGAGELERSGQLTSE
jgi:hypothetical protein